MKRAVLRICLMLLFLVGFGYPSAGKIYVWKDAQGKTHYVNDEEDVPPDILADETKYRLIETTPRPSIGYTVRTPVKTRSIGGTTVQKPNVLVTGRKERFKAGPVQQEYRKILLKMRDYRKRNKNLHTPQYKALQRKLMELRKRMIVGGKRN